MSDLGDEAAKQAGEDVTGVITAGADAAAQAVEGIAQDMVADLFGLARDGKKKGANETEHLSPVEFPILSSCIEKFKTATGEAGLVAHLPNDFVVDGKDYSGYTLPLGGIVSDNGYMATAKLESPNVACVTSPAGLRSFVTAPAFVAAARAYEATNALDKTIEIDHGEILQELSQVEPAVTRAFLDEEEETPDELRKKLAEMTAEMETLKTTISDVRAGVAAVAADDPASLKKAMELASQAVETAVQAAVDKFSKIFEAVNSISDRIAKAITCDLPSLAARAGAKTLETSARPFARAAQSLSGRAEKMRGRARGLESSKADKMFAKAQTDLAGKHETVETVKAGQAASQTRTRSTV